MTCWLLLCQWLSTIMKEIWRQWGQHSLPTFTSHGTTGLQLQLWWWSTFDHTTLQGLLASHNLLIKWGEDSPAPIYSLETPLHHIPRIRLSISWHSSQPTTSIRKLDGWMRPARPLIKASSHRAISRRTDPKGSRKDNHFWVSIICRVNTCWTFKRLDVSPSRQPVVPSCVIWRWTVDTVCSISANLQLALPAFTPAPLFWPSLSTVSLTLFGCHLVSIILSTWTVSYFRGLVKLPLTRAFCNGYILH